MPICLTELKTAIFSNIYLYLLAFYMHKDGPNTTNLSLFEDLPASDFDLLELSYHVCDAQGLLSAWTVCYSALELSSILT